MLINTRAAIGHDAVVEDFSQICPGAQINGNCKVGRRALIGSNASIFPGISIGEGATVGGNSQVIRIVKANKTVNGVPAVCLPNKLRRGCFMNEELKNAIAEELQVDPSILTTDKNLADLDGWDSVSALTIMVILGDEIGVPVLPNDMRMLVTFGDVEKLISSKKGKQNRLKTSIIKAIAHALPTTVITQSDLERRFGDKAVKSIAKMSGILERRVVPTGQCASDLAFAAATRVIEHLKIDRSSIDLLTFASQTPDYRIPKQLALYFRQARLIRELLYI